MHKDWDFTSGDVKLAPQRLSLKEQQGAGYLPVLDYLGIRQPDSGGR